MGPMKKDNPEPDRRHTRRLLDVTELESMVAGARASQHTRRKRSRTSRASANAEAIYTGDSAAASGAVDPLRPAADAEPVRPGEAPRPRNRRARTAEADHTHGPRPATGPAPGDRDRQREQHGSSNGSSSGR